MTQSLEASRDSVRMGTEDCFLFHSHSELQSSLSLASLARMTGLEGSLLAKPC